MNNSTSGASLEYELRRYNVPQNRYKRKNARVVNLKCGCDFGEINLPTVNDHYSKIYDSGDEHGGFFTCDIDFTIKGKYYEIGAIELEDFKDQVMKANKEEATKLEDLEYGDMINMGTYRGCGLWILGYGDFSNNKLKLMKTYGEMGYGLPLEFSDSPPGYYKEYFKKVTAILDLIIDVERTFFLHPKTRKPYDLVVSTIKKKGEVLFCGYHSENGDETAKWEGMKREKIDKNEFPKGYYCRINYEGWDDGGKADFKFYSLVYFVDEKYTLGFDKHLFIKQYEKRLRMHRNECRVILYFTLFKGTELAWDVCEEIVKFSVS